jgi:hypothetical protein
MTTFDIETQMLIDGVWTDISADVRYADGITITRGRPDEASTVEPSSCSLTLDNRSGNYSPRNPNGAYYGKLGRNTPIRVLAPTTEVVHLHLQGNGLSTLGTGLAYAATPDVAALDITGDIDVRVDVEPHTWRPGDDWYGYGLASKKDYFPDTRSWSFWLEPDGRLAFYWSANGTNEVATVYSTVAVDEGSPRLTVRVTLDVNNGAAGSDVKFWTATDINGAYTQLGSTVTTAGVTSVHSGTAAVRVGYALSDSSQDVLLQGKVYGAQVRSGIGGTVVTSPDFTAQDSTITDFTDAQGRAWSLVGPAVIVNPGARFHGEVSSWPPRWDKTARDATVPIQASGIFRRLSQGSSEETSVLYRGLTSLGSLVAYWPCEDGSESTQFASAIPGHQGMTLDGTAEFAGYEGYAASKPIPVIEDGSWIGHVPFYPSTGVVHVRFLVHVPAAGVASDTSICRIHTDGTASRWAIRTRSDGAVSLVAQDGEGVNLLSTAFQTVFALNGVDAWLQLTLVQNGANVDWTLRRNVTGTLSAVSQTGTLASQTATRAWQVVMNGWGAGLAGGSIGHVAVLNESLPSGALTRALSAYDGERATERVLRVGTELGVEVVIAGDFADSTLLGPQLPGMQLEALRGAAASDMGILHEPRGVLGLAYRPRASLYSQTPRLTLPYGDRVLAQIEPVEDDESTRNDVTVTRTNGSSARAELTTGAMSVQPPPDGVGRYEEDVTVSLEDDSGLLDQASWRVHVGTVDEARYPVLGFDLAMPAFTGDADLTSDARRLDIGDLLTVTGLPAFMPPDDVQQIAQGFSEVLTGHQWTTDVNCSPASPYAVAVWDDESGPGEARYSSDGTTLAAGGALLLDGVSPGRASTPSHASLDFTQNLDVRAHVALDDWTPGALSTLVSKWMTGGGQQSWRFRVATTTGLLTLSWSEDGAAALFASSTVAPTVADGEPLWVRATLDVDNGAAGRDIRFYTSPDGSAWTQLGATVTQAGTTSLFVGTAEVNVGSYNNGASERMAGRVFSAEVRNGIGGTIVASPNFGEQLAGTTSFVDSTGKTWTVTSPATLDGGAIVAITPTGPVWGDADAPYDLMIGGERMRVSAVTGVGASQIFTVTRSVNGVVKTHDAGTEVALFKPAIYAL